jgi:CheY-like chemotaxis protein
MPSGSVILIADDEDDAALLLENAFEMVKVSSPRRVVRNGQEAIDYLSGNGIYADREKYPWPALMLLDLKMPVRDGFAVLDWWRQQNLRTEFPIVIMTSSNQEADIQRAMFLGATAFQIKRVSFNYLVEVVRELRERWLKPLEAVKPAGFVRASDRERRALRGSLYRRESA